MALLTVEIHFVFLLIAAAIWSATLVSRSRPLVLGLAAIVLGAIFGPEFHSVRVGPLPVTGDRILWGGFCMLILSNRLLRRDGRLFQFSAIDLALVSLLGVLVISTFTHDWRRSDNLPLGRLIFFQMIPTSFFWLGRHTYFQQRDLKWFLMLGVGFGVYLAFYRHR